MSCEGNGTGNDFQTSASSSSSIDLSQEQMQPANSLNQSTVSHLSPSIAKELLHIELELCTQLNLLTFSPPVKYVYSPIEYAFNLHAQYVRKFCNTTKKILFLGMNPGPWGMSQTGVPFGEVTTVKDWFGLDGLVNKPKKEHPKREVSGLNCHRSEISGKRFWGLFQELCGPNPHVFFKHCFLYNQCPIALMSETGKNITPAELKASESKVLLALCDAALVKVLLLLQVQLVVAIGKYAEKRASIAVNGALLKKVKVVSIPHPSPRNASSSRNWTEKVTKILEGKRRNKIMDPSSVEPVENSARATNDASPSKDENNQTNESVPVIGDILGEDGMEVAMKLARQALAVGEVPVGCVFIYEGLIIAIGRNTVNQTRNATRHAEINCIDDVLKWCKNNNKDSHSVLSNTEVFVTVEPCIMCAGALHNLHLKQVTYGCQNDRFGGCGTVLDAGLLAENPCKIIGGVRAEEAMQLLKDFYKGTNPNAPVPNVKKKTGRKAESDLL